MTTMEIKRKGTDLKGKKSRFSISMTRNNNCSRKYITAKD